MHFIEASPEISLDPPGAGIILARSETSHTLYLTEVGDEISRRY